MSTEREPADPSRSLQRRRRRIGIAEHDIGVLQNFPRTSEYPICNNKLQEVERKRLTHKVSASAVCAQARDLRIARRSSFHFNLSTPFPLASAEQLRSSLSLKHTTLRPETTQGPRTSRRPSRSTSRLRASGLEEAREPCPRAQCDGGVYSAPVVGRCLIFLPGTSSRCYAFPLASPAAFVASLRRAVRPAARPRG